MLILNLKWRGKEKRFLKKNMIVVCCACVCVTFSIFACYSSTRYSTKKLNPLLDCSIIRRRQKSQNPLNTTEGEDLLTFSEFITSPSGIPSLDSRPLPPQFALHKWVTVKAA